MHLNHDAGDVTNKQSQRSNDVTQLDAASHADKTEKSDPDKMTHVQKLATPPSGDNGNNNSLPADLTKEDPEMIPQVKSSNDLNGIPTKMHCDVIADDVHPSSTSQVCCHRHHNNNTGFIFTER